MSGYSGDTSSPSSGRPAEASIILNSPHFGIASVNGTNCETMPTGVNRKRSRSSSPQPILPPQLPSLDLRPMPPVETSDDTATLANTTPVVATTSTDNNVPPSKPMYGTGCLACGADDDHANLLLCETCNDEYHTYCLDPPLRNVPESDFFCDKCKPVHKADAEDGLDTMVSCLGPKFTARFGEIVWAAGGVGFGWWPACIYDPRLTVGGARQLARRNLGKKHLVYFFECHDAPFTVLGDSKITLWEPGLIEEYDLGRTARAFGKNRAILFEQALQAAISENDKPVEYRLDWNHQKAPRQSSTNGGSRRHDGGCTKKKARKPVERDQREKDTPTIRRSGRGGKQTSEFVENEEEAHDLMLALELSRNEADQQKQREQEATLAPFTPFVKRTVVSKRHNLDAAILSLTVSRANEIETLEDGELFCKILLLQDTAELIGGVATNIGFITLPSRRLSTFADARRVMETDLDEECLPACFNWKFYMPRLGPMGRKQEWTLGPMLAFMQSTTTDARLGEGTSRNPLKLVIAPYIPTGVNVAATTAP